MPQISIWEKESFFAPQDVIIIGSGFVGLWSALRLILQHPQKKITVLERGFIPTGASTRNAGFSCFGSPSELVEDVASMGEANMWKLVKMRYKGILEIRKYFNNIEIDYDASGGYECFTKDSADWQKSIANLDWLNKGLEDITGERNLFNVHNEKLADFGFEGFEHLIANKLEGGVHSGKFVQALLLKVQSLGVQVLTNIEVLDYVENGQHIFIHTNQSIDFTCSQLLLCTNAFTKKLLPQIDIKPCRGQVFVTDAIPGLVIRGTFHFDNGYYYFRNLNDRLLIGGARNKAFDAETTTDMQTTEIIQAELEAFVCRHLLPHATFSITDRWSGIMAMGSEKLPIVQQLSNRVFCCVRMSGMGVALAPVVAAQVADLMNDAAIKS